MVTALQRIAAEAVQVEPPAAGDEDLLAARPAVVEPLQVIAPAAVLVDLVEDPQPSRRQLAAQDVLAVRGDVPVQVGRACARQAERERGLADLARSGDERHLAREVGAQRGGEVPCEVT